MGQALGSSFLLRVGAAAKYIISSFFITSNIRIYIARGNDLESCDKGGSLAYQVMGLVPDNA